MNSKKRHGVYTLEDLKERCYIDPDSGCWHWRGTISEGRPKVNLFLNGRAQVMHGRRAAVTLSRGGLGAGSRVWGILTCKSKDCVSPSHSKVGTYEEYGADMAVSGKWKNLPSKVRAARENARAAQGKLNMEIARAIRNSDEPAPVLARRYGIADKIVYAILEGKRWKESKVANADVFSWAQTVREAA